MAPRNIRRSVEEDHAELRVIAGAVEEVASQVVRGEGRSVGALRERGLELHERLCRHLDLEDRILLPAVEAAGSDGPQRAESLRREHAEQRALLEYILERLEDIARPSLVLGRELQNFAELLRDDIEYEESTILPYLDLPRS